MRPAQRATCDCPTCAPRAASVFDRFLTWFLVLGFLLMPGRALLHLAWEAISQ